MPAGATTLYAQWTANTAYALSYDANSGTGTPPPASNHAAGSLVTTSDGAWATRAGYTLAGWNTAANGSGTAVALGGSLTMPAEATTLYAQWTANPAYALSYAANNGTGTPPAASDQPAGSLVTTSNGAWATRAGYTLAGWNTAANGSGTAVALGGSLTMPAEATTLYAQWTQPPTLDKAFTPSIIDLGQASTLSITLGNPNPISTTALVLSADLVDTLPAGMTVVSIDSTGTTCTISSVSTTSGSVRYANGASIPPGGCVIKVQVTATMGGKYVNLLAVGDLQTNGGGNEEPAEADLYVDPADLAITKTLTTAGPYAAGQLISFTIVGTNNGPDLATGVVITDVPSNLTIQSVSGACTALPCTLGNLAAGSTVSITVVARVNAVGNFTNTATITGAQPDPVPANNSASANGQAADPIPPVAIPTLTELGMILMSLFLLAMARRRMSRGR